jgi:hypothetical protein
MASDRSRARDEWEALARPHNVAGARVSREHAARAHQARGAGGKIQTLFAPRH